MCTALDTERPYRIRPRTIIDFRGPVPEHSNDITGCFVDPANADLAGRWLLPRQAADICPRGARGDDHGMPSMNRVCLQPGAEQHRALRMLAGSPLGCTEGIMLAFCAA
jgi:hypothetical protein